MECTRANLPNDVQTPFGADIKRLVVAGLARQASGLNHEDSGPVGPAGPVVSAQTGGPGPCAAQTLLYYRGPSPAQGKSRDLTYEDLEFICV